MLKVDYPFGVCTITVQIYDGNKGIITLANYQRQIQGLLSCGWVGGA